MMELSVLGSGQALSVSDAVFGREFNRDLVHQVVVAFRNAGRAGTKAQLSRAEVSGTTKKFKKQKGGGARHGDYRAPIFIGGGVTFAAKPRSFEQKVNKKMYRAAISVILSELNRQSRLTVVDAIDVADSKTKNLVAQLDELKAGRPLIVTEDAVQEDISTSARYAPAQRQTYSAMYQLAKISATRGALVHDDRADALEGLVRHFQPNIATDQDRSLEHARKKAHEEMVRDPLGHNRCLPRPGVSGTTLFTSRLKHRR